MKKKKKPRFIKLEYATKDRNDNDNPAMKHDRNFNIFVCAFALEFFLFGITENVQWHKQVPVRHKLFPKCTAKIF